MKQKRHDDSSEFFVDVAHAISGLHFAHFDDELSFLLDGEFRFRQTDFLFNTGYRYHLRADYN